MELNYTDKDFLDVGIVDCVGLDYDCAGNKDFELTVETGGSGMEKRSMWYAIGTEYMGIVESVASDSEEDTVTYSGTNTRGLLAKKILEGERELIVYAGNAGDIIGEMLKQTDSEDLFVCDPTELDIPECQIVSYTNVYDAIVQLLKSVNAVPVFVVKNDRKVHISADLRDDYSDEIQYQGNNTYSFKITDDGLGYNHMICKATEDSGDRYVIHLFTDENGGVQEYSRVESPVQDSEYILDKSKQLIFGVDERTMVLSSDVSVTENYVLTKERPADWTTNYMDYYTNDDSSYKEVEATQQEVYTKLTSKPKDWNTGYANYYIKSSTVDGGSYSSVSADTINSYKLLTSKPWDWEKNYSIYYERVKNSDGTGYTYQQVNGIEKPLYKLQTMQPTDWADNFKNYFYISNKKYVAVQGIGKKKNKAPKWRTKKYYSNVKKTCTPGWQRNKYYYVYSQRVSIPAWSNNLYYSKFILDTAPSWTEGKYYVKVLDHYAAMIENALQELETKSPSRKAEMTITDYDCRIGDVVGCVDNRSGIEICEEITNIIFKIKNGLEEYEYTVGGN